MTGRVQTALVVACLSLLVCLAGCNSAADGAVSETARVTPLPSPIVSGGESLAEALAERRSVRSFADQTLTPSQIGQLLWAAQGITHPQGYRTAPSAGALYPLEAYVVTAAGVYHYEPQGHLVAVHSGGDRRQALYEAALRQEPVREAPAVFVITAIYERTAQKYGADRSPRYVHLEAGHAAQNLLLQAVALGLAAVPIGAFHDEKIQEALGLPEAEEPLYLIPVGHPLEANP
jgi:SagB-type dehydrogenase family enzyme